MLRKFDGRPHRQVTGRLLGEDPFGTWVATPRGTVVTYHYGAKPPELTSADAVRLLPAALDRADGWFTAMFLAEPAARELYCDVSTPPRWTGPAEITVIDLDIDLIRYRADGRVEVEDEDEFERHRITYGYPAPVVAGALAAAASLRAALLANDEPFATHYRGWLAKV